MGREIAIGPVRLGGRPAVVAAAGESDLDALVTAAADILELRADLFDEPTPGRVGAALERLRATDLPIIFTARAASEGGRAMPEARRAELYHVALPLVAAIDAEIASGALATTSGCVRFLRPRAMRRCATLGPSRARARTGEGQPRPSRYLATT